MSEFEIELCFPKNKLAKIFNVAPSAVTKWKIAPVLKDESGLELFYLPQVVAYKESSKKKGELSLAQERAKLAREQSRKTKIESETKSLELEKIKGKTISTEAVEKFLAEMIITCRSRLLSIPSRCVSVLLTLQSGDAEDLLRDEISQALEELSKKLVLEEDNNGSVESTSEYKKESGETSCSSRKTKSKRVGG